MNKNKITVNINGNEYIIKGEESEEAMLRVASYVDEEIRKLTAINNKLNPTFAAVLSALNITNELFKLKTQYEELKVNSQDPIRKLNELRSVHEKSLSDNIRLQKELDERNRELSEIKYELGSLKSQYESLHSEYMAKGEDLSKSYRECELIRREKDNKQKELERVKVELSEAKRRLIELQNQLMENQIELVKVKKEFDEYKLGIGQDSK